MTRALGGRLYPPGPEGRARTQGCFLPVLARYCADDPYVVRLVLLLDDSSSLTWDVEREVLRAALDRPAGAGVLTAHPEGSDVVLRRTFLRRTTDLLLPAAELRELLTCTDLVLAPGQEAARQGDLLRLLHG